MSLKKKVLVSTAALAGTVAATTAVASADTITVKAGDTVSELAEKYNTTTNVIQQLNNLKDANLIFVGQQLKINNDNEQTVQQPAAGQVQSNQQQAQPQQSVQNTNTQQQSSNYTSNVSGGEAAAKAWIAGVESGGNYGARNGRYVGKYQLTDSYLHGDYSAANQERVADQYVASRYGSWQNAKSHWLSNGWY